MLLSPEAFLQQVADPEIEQMYSLWAQARAARSYPSQRDIDLPAIPKLLPKLFILDRVGDTFRYRFMGTAIDQHVGMSLTGKLFTDVRRGPWQAEITKFFRDVLDNGCMGMLTTRIPSEIYGWRDYRRFGLPIADDGLTPNKVIGLFLIGQNDPKKPARRSVLEGENDGDGLVSSQFARL